MAVAGRILACMRYSKVVVVEMGPRVMLAERNEGDKIEDSASVVVS